MADMTETSPSSLLDRLDDAALASVAPSQTELMRELRIKAKPGWTSRLSPSVAAFVTNKKGMAGVILLLAMILFSILAPMFSEYNPHRRAGKPHVAPSYEHVLGTTRMGKDVYTQVAYGGRISLAVGFGAGIAAAVIGLAIGISAGYFGGRVDDILTFF